MEHVPQNNYSEQIKRLKIIIDNWDYLSTVSLKDNCFTWPEGTELAGETWNFNQTLCFTAHLFYLPDEIKQDLILTWPNKKEGACLAYPFIGYCVQNPMTIPDYRFTNLPERLDFAKHALDYLTKNNATN